MARETAQTPVWWRGVKITARMRDMIRYAERRFQKRYPGVTFVPTQGSWANGSLSGGTHSGAGAIDWRTWHMTAAQRIYMIRCLKDAGAAIWFRPKNWDGNGGAEHAHMLDRVTTGMDPGAKWQVAQYDARRSGLRSNRVDLTYRTKPAVKWSYPLGKPVAA
jgi:hypothetical protein